MIRYIFDEYEFNAFIIQCRFRDCKDNKMKKISLKFQISFFRKKQFIRDFFCFFLKYHSNVVNIHENLKRREKNFLNFQKIHYKYYNDMTKSMQTNSNIRINDKIIVNFAKYYIDRRYSHSFEIDH